MAAPYGTAIVNAALALQHDVEWRLGSCLGPDRYDGLGTGPYRIAGWKSERALRSNETKITGSPGLATISARSSSVQFPKQKRGVSSSSKEKRNRPEPRARGHRGSPGNPDIASSRGTNLTVRYLAMTIGGPMESAAVRQAMCWAFPYVEVLEGVLMDYRESRSWSGQRTLPRICSFRAHV